MRLRFWSGSLALSVLLAVPCRAQLLGGKLLYNSVQPCRVLDTRGHHGPVAAGTTLTFAVVGSGDLSSQGGSATGCNIPGFANGKPQALAVMINFIAVSPQGPGDLRAYPADGTVPNASVVNYAVTSGLNIANAIVLPLGQATEGQDLKVQAAVSGTEIVADVVGYFTRATRRFYLSLGPAGSGGNGAGATTVCAPGFHFAGFDEIHSPEILTYDKSAPFAASRVNQGNGAPFGFRGWVRTGSLASTGGNAGAANCGNWASALASDKGTVVELHTGWSDPATFATPYLASTSTCDQPEKAWCIED